MDGNFAPQSLASTLLWKRLNKPFASERETEVAKYLVNGLPDVCRRASDRMKGMATFHPQFTLHDDVHLLRVTELMAKLIPKQVLEEVLNPVEIALLILAAHYHDVGMVPDVEEASAIHGSSEFGLARENWLLEHSGYEEAKRILNEAGVGADEQSRCSAVLRDFEQAAFTHFIRLSHARRSAEIVLKTLGEDSRLRIGTGHLADAVGLLCTSHNEAATWMNPANGFYVDSLIGDFRINLVYLGIVLRLADILDFDRERTPDELYRCINFSSPISLQEWEKHRSVTGWIIAPNSIRFDFACERPEYERAIRRFMAQIDEELLQCREIKAQFPSAQCRYILDLPPRTDLSRIRAKNNAYLYHGDLEISLSRDEVVKLLMTDNLYRSPSLAVRELLQNAWDALRHRAAIVKRDDETEWKVGRVEFEHGIDEHGREFVRCVDNGVGMDESIIQRFLVRAGRSYYRSPEFERERLSFARVNADFDPCARFGIGFMSYFMLGDHILIKTRRYRGSRKGHGQPLIVEINGLGSLVVFRPGQIEQPPGTSITIYGRRKPARFGTWNDKVHLVDTIYGYALAGEFPVRARCTIPEIADEIEIPAGIAEPRHPAVECGARKFELFEQDFSEVDPRMHGKVVCVIPLDESGSPTVANEELGWKVNERGHADFFVTNSKGGHIWSWDGRTCLDGILVAGMQGRSCRWESMVGARYNNPVRLGEDTFVLDVRGSLKPELNPDRSPPDSHGIMRDAGPTWRRLRRLAGDAHGALWEKVLLKFSDEKHAKGFWQLAGLHTARFARMKRGILWEHLKIPVTDLAGKLLFRKFQDLPSFRFAATSEAESPLSNGELTIAGDAEMSSWKNINEFRFVPEALNDVILGMSTIALRDGQPTIEFNRPTEPEARAHHSLLFDWGDRQISAMRFGAGFEDTLAVAARERVVNFCHPVVSFLSNEQYISEGGPVFQFLYELVFTLTEPEALEALAKQDFKAPRQNWHFNTLGYYWRAAEEHLLPAHLSPPYRCWTASHGFFEISHDTLRALAKVQVIDWQRRDEPRPI
jgi:hypothetical protein